MTVNSSGDRRTTGPVAVPRGWLPIALAALALGVWCAVGLLPEVLAQS
ncbi:hypothetical protein [Kytococcus sp. Marseille-QA3725]